MAIDQEQQAAVPKTSPPMGESTPRRIRVVRVLAFVVVPAAFVGLIAFGFLKTAPPEELVNKQAPEFSLPLLGGGRLSSADLKGHPVVINFWASWCAPCREEAPLLERRWRAYRDQGLKVIGVNVQDSSDAAAGFVREYGLTFPIVRDVDLVLYRELGVRGLPETFFVDHNGRFTAVGSGPHVGQQGGTKVLGPLKPAVLESQIEGLLDKLRADPARPPGSPTGGAREGSAGG